MIVITAGLSGTYLSATIPDLDFTIDGYRAFVEITSDSDVLFSDYLFPFNGEITFSELSELVQPYVHRRLLAELTISITEEFEDNDRKNTSTLTAKVMYCSADLGVSNADSFLSAHFLTLLDGEKTTAPGRLEFLHYIGADDASATAEYSDGSTADFKVETLTGSSVFKTVDVSPDRFSAEGKELVAYDIRAGQRAQRFVIDFGQPDCAPVLMFENSFGCDEIVYCTGTHTVSPEYTRSSAFINKMKRNYLIEEDRKFKADTGVLSFTMANWLDELFRSQTVKLVNFFNGEATVGKDIVIIESKSEYSNDDDELPRFTFTYTYAQKNHNVMDLRRGGRIFDNTFDHTFN